MSLRTVALLFVAPLAFASLGQEAKKSAAASSSYHDHTYGLSLTPPAFEADDDAAMAIVAIFYAPPADGFSASLNVVRQKFPGGIPAFVTTSEAQFKEMNFEVLSKSNAKLGGHDSVEWVYTGELNGRDLKFHALAVEQGDGIFLLTGTSLKKDFDTNDLKFKASLASFRLDE